MNKIEKEKEEKKEEGEVGKNVDLLDAKKDATLEVPAPEKSYLEHPKKPTPDDRVRCRILKKDGYRTQIPSPEDQLKFVDHLFPAGEIIEVQSYKLRDLIERGTVELVA